MAKVRSSGTGPEMRVAQSLREQGLLFEINASDLPGRPDVVFRREKVAVFVHGCFWHGHTNCPRAKLPVTNAMKWESKILTNARRDRRVAVSLRKQGWSVLTVWECHLAAPALARFYLRLLRALHRDKQLTAGQNLGSSLKHAALGQKALEWPCAT